MAKAEHRVEECFERAKDEAGLADYQGRNWIAWHHHQILALLAAWFLTQETRRGKNPDPGSDVAATSGAHRGRDRDITSASITHHFVVAEVLAGYDATKRRGCMHIVHVMCCHD